MIPNDLSQIEQEAITNRKVAGILLLWIIVLLVVISTINYLRFIELKSNLVQEGKSYASNINTQLAGSDAILEGFSALFGTIGEVNPQIVRDYVRIVTQNNPHIFSLEIAIKIPSGKLGNLAQDLHSIYPDFTVKSFSYNSARKWESISHKDSYVPLIFIAPFRAGSDEVIGLDIDSVPFLKSALDKSIDLHKQVATMPFNLVEGNRAFVVFDPIHKYFHHNLKMGAFDYDSELITDVVIDTQQLSKQAHIDLEHGQSLALYSADFLADDPMGNLFTLTGDQVSSYEMAIFPELVFEEDLRQFNSKFNIKVKHQLGLVDFDIKLNVFFIVISVISSFILLAYLQAMQKRVLAKIENEKKLWSLANYDSLTGLAKRNLMLDRLSHQLAHARRMDDLVIICMLDLDGFKLVNDQLGHDAGDLLLIEVAKRLQKSVRQSDTVARFGGDEFSLILCDVKDIGECEQTFQRIIAALAAPYQINSHIAHVTASLGATIFPNDGDTPELLLRHADQAMYEAKESGKNCYCLFNPSRHKQQISNQALLDKIGNALAERQLVLFYQPQIDCRLGSLVGVEALIRWNHPILGLLAPSEFIPLLEHDNLIIKVGEWVIHEALRQQVEWRQAGLNLDISVNIASRQLHQQAFVDQLTKMLHDQDPDAIRHLTIEIVETAALEDIPRVSDTINQCREIGVKFAIDDFGTGFSSLAHLKHLRVNELKIDKSFVSSMLNNPEDLQIVKGVISLGLSFRHSVVAEGVESIDQILMLMDLGCNVMQGFVFARPMPAEQLTGWLKDFQPDPLWNLPLSQAPSRDYFELLLAETNHRHWIDRQLLAHQENPDDFDPGLELTCQKCRFGHWLHSDASRQFGKAGWLLEIQAIHQNVHDSAIRLLEYQNNGSRGKADAELVHLRQQQTLLDDSLKNARKELSNQNFTVNLNKSR